MVRHTAEMLQTRAGCPRTGGCTWPFEALQCRQRPRLSRLQQHPRGFAAGFQRAPHLCQMERAGSGGWDGTCVTLEGCTVSGTLRRCQKSEQPQCCALLSAPLCFALARSSTDPSSASTGIPVGQPPVPLLLAK